MSTARMEVRKIPAIPLDRTSAILSYSKDRLAFLYAAARDHGPVVELWPKTFLVTGAEEVHDVLRVTNRKTAKDRDLRLRKAKEVPGSPQLADWMSTRRAVIRGMTTEILAEHATWLAIEAETLVDELAMRGCVADLPESIEGLTSRSIARFCFGSRDASAVLDASQAALDALFPIFLSTFEFPAYLKALQPREWAAGRRLRDLRRVLRKAIESPGEGGVVDVLKCNGAKEEMMINALTSILLAAHWVPAAGISWAMVELAQNPVERRLAIEAANAEWAPGGRSRTLERVIDETLRLWPPIWISDRAIEEESTCGAWTLPAHSRAVLPFWVIHRLATCFEDPERFDSRRWEGLSPPPGAYAPFSGGPRRCLGANFARVEMSTILAVLLRNLHIELEGTVVPDASSQLSPAGYKLHMRRAN
ncbi:cytochrome P450 [Nocardia brasiliensis]|nr:cytochrome P450 [Nocardia brasiliensis]